MKTILLTGATGYIGSHTWVELLNKGYDVVGIDNLSNSSRSVLDRIAAITGKTPRFIQSDVRDIDSLIAIILRNKIDAVMHFAGLKAVGDSVLDPMAYYDNNVLGLMSLVRAMERTGRHDIVFSSSATVYGDPETMPIRENARLNPTNPYGRTKLMCEQILQDLEASQPGEWRCAILRYFNPVGAHPSGKIGEDPLGKPNNLMPFVAQVAVGRRKYLEVFGDDYPTVDGTGMRDYIHVVDLAKGHIAALETMVTQKRGFTVNLGTGTPHSVMQLVEAYRLASGATIPVQYAPRRSGDVAITYADPTLSATLLNWKATQTLADMCIDSWNWQSHNPKGYTK